MNNLATKLSSHHQLKYLINAKRLLVKPLGRHAIVQEWTSITPFWAVQVERLEDNTYQLTQTIPPPILVPIVEGLPCKFNGTFEEVTQLIVDIATRFKI